MLYADRIWFQVTDAEILCPMATSMFLERVILFSLAMSAVIFTALEFWFWERSHLGDSGMNLEM